MSENQKKEKIEFAKTSGDDESRSCWRYNFSLGGKELFSLQAVDIKDNKIYYHNQSNNEIPVQFIIVPQGENFNQTNLEKYCNNVKGILSKRDGLRDKLDQEFTARILAAKPFVEKGYTNQLDLVLDEALVYAYIFTHTDPEQHEKIRLFDWENIDKGQHGFLKDSLQSNKIKTTLNIQPEEEVYLPMSVHKSEKDGLHHISFTTIKINIVGTCIIKSFDTLSNSPINNEEYISNQQSIKYTMFKTSKQGTSGCGFLTALNAVSYIKGGEAVCPALVEEKGKTLPIEETKKTLIDGFGYTYKLVNGEYQVYKIEDTQQENVVFTITKDIIEAIQQENKEGTQHGTPPIEHKTIAGSFPSFASIDTSSISTDDINYNHQSYQPAPQQDNILS